VVVAYLSREVLFVLNAAFSLRGLTSGALLGALALVVLWKRGGAIPVAAGMVASLIFMVGVSLNWFWRTQIDWPWYTFIGTSVTLLVAIVVRAVLPEQGTPTPTRPKSELTHEHGG
jgi:Na+/proline symporter